MTRAARVIFESVKSEFTLSHSFKTSSFLRGGGVEIGRIRRLIVIKNCRRRGLGVKNCEILPTSQMDGPLTKQIQENYSKVYFTSNGKTSVICTRAARVIFEIVKSE